MRVCNWCDHAVPADASTCPNCGSAEIGERAGRPGSDAATLARVALAMAVLWLGGVGSLVAIVLGSMARARMAETGEGGGRLATAAVVLGAIGLAVSAVLGWMLFQLSF